MPNVFTFTEAGGHVTNEDAFLIERHPADVACLMCVLADGQGGRAGGRRAAEIACRGTLDAALRYPVAELTNPLLWPTILRVADEAVAADHDAGFTTLLALCVAGDRLVGSSSGDSAVLLIHDGRAEELTAKQLKNPPVGSGGAVFVPFVAARQPPWRVLAMSDGVWKFAGWDQVVTIASSESGQAVIDSLAARARLPGNGRFQDDFTVVVIERE
jgi:serine/threonine protein phosphatase PrpC